MFADVSTVEMLLDNWNTCSIADMGGMFSDAPTFRMPINSWNTCTITDMGGMFSDAGVLDPTILQKGISTIKEQMKDVQREALMIETEMEKRFSDMINKNSANRYLPKSLTEEIIQHKNAMNELKLKQAIGEAGETAAPEAE